jgi:hypothetical protein
MRGTQFAPGPMQRGAFHQLDKSPQILDKSRQNHPRGGAIKYRDLPTHFILDGGIGIGATDWKVVSRFVIVGRPPLGAYPSGTQRGNTG